MDSANIAYKFYQYRLFIGEKSSTRMLSYQVSETKKNSLDCVKILYNYLDTQSCLVS